ncbi:WD40/YVTN/BNR-like repeat-containing protein [Faunimonas sp. B44]|uniref:WD40/YVTN/BNR-like repeat-containing protein n=1 Tax=Faunimonas sp. B44 TaxID=3461493 RepID=UPI004044CBA9
MTFLSPTYLGVGVAAVLAAGMIGYSVHSDAAATISIAELLRGSHVHGLAVDRADSSRLLIATHHGLFRTAPEGQVEPISDMQDFMGFNAHPNEPGILFASGHPAVGGNLGFVVSNDAGRSWRQVSPGVNGPVDFHQMAVSALDPDVIYGSHGGIQVSRDGGKTWRIAGPDPARLIDLAASADDPDVLYAATELGLLVSRDGARTWTPILQGMPVSLVEVTSDGTIYAFLFGQGLLRASEPAASFATISDGFGESYLLHLAVDPGDPNRLFAASSDGEILHSIDQGRTWGRLADAEFHESKE